MAKSYNHKNIIKYYLIIFFIINLLGFSIDLLLYFIGISDNIYNRLLSYNSIEIFMSIIVYSFIAIALYFLIKIHFMLKYQTEQKDSK